MSYTASKLLAIAAAEIGYKEKASNAYLDDKDKNAGHNNWNKYARDLHAKGYYNGNKNGYAWCDCFVDWCFLQLCGGDAKVAQQVECQTGDLGAGCYWSAKYYKDAGRFFTKDPQPGDQVFFGDYAHTGLVESVTATTITTIEGNTSDQVARRNYNRTSSYITGFGRPRFDAEPAEQKPAQPAQPSQPVTGLKLGDKVKMSKEAPVWGKSYKFSSWVYGKELYVRGISGDRITVSVLQTGAVTGNVDKKYLTLLTAAAEEPALIYTVVRGDTLWGIASKYLGSGTRYPEIVQLNGLKTSVIYSGQKLKIPQK